jgi:hypothetical protein
MNEKQYPIDITACAEQIGCCRQLLHYHAKQGNLPTIRIGRLVCIDAEVWADWKKRYHAGEFRR